MRDFRDAKAMARSLRHGLNDHGLDLTHSQSLELTAKAFGYDNWNILAAKIDAVRPAPAEPGPDDPKTLHCSFCGKSSHDVRALIAGPSAFICDECVGLCDDIVEHQNVLRLLKADDARGDDADGYSALDAYLAGRNSEQLRAYIAGVEKDLDRRREQARLATAAIAARRSGRRGGAVEAPDNLPAYLKGKSDEELIGQKALFQAEIAQALRAIDIVRRVLESRA